MDDLAAAMMARARPTRDRPLAGLTILLVEDSRFASEAMRLLCLRSGARLRRADTVAAARRHLAAYAPDVAIVDLGLPDGSGADLIADLAAAPPLVVLGLSGGDPEESKGVAAQAGAHGFLAKPVAGLAAFQATVLRHLPDDRRPLGLSLVTQDRVEPDRLALAEDMDRAAALLDSDPAFAAAFVAGLARADEDTDLLAAALRAAAEDGPEDLRGAVEARRAGGGL
ncbi:response regulator [Jannaschia sp. Os4]|uniref:response regulator n=1 Tax=Jannaschia sp. Os4 TaxID=2807617 RepID=UPI00193966A8|nr:response regulator [Jannaschia sp. Os4]MBM2574956.1 response regulator [Jannaschia sp. Os4]